MQNVNESRHIQFYKQHIFVKFRGDQHKFGKFDDTRGTWQIAMGKDNLNKFLQKRALFKRGQRI
jgi:hypothetical protein